MDDFVNLDANNGWSRSLTTFVRGAAFLNDTLIQKDSFIKELEDIKDVSEFITLLKKLNGFFAIVLQKNGIVMAAVDKVRSMPLFYGLKEGNLYLSDDAGWVRTQVKNGQNNQVAEAEFLLTGYVTGEDTLCLGVKQLQAGEILTTHVEGGRKVVQKIRYYRYLHNFHNGEARINKESLSIVLDRVVINCTQRLIQFANGREIVIPLSGGYDSRLIAMTLKRLGYNNVIAFTYGKRGNKESEISKWVAKCLDMKWYFVPYNNYTWWKWFHSEERNAYYRRAHNLVSVPHIQDWPAVKVLKEQNIIDENAIFVPGHSGDFLAGSHIPTMVFNNTQLNLALFIKAIIERHYSLWPFNELDAVVQEQLKSRIMQTGEGRDLSIPSHMADAFEEWDWQERQAKFIINSVRVYEFWGYNWWLPLWDAEMMDFWAGVPLEFRQGQKFYSEYVSKIFGRITGIGVSVAKRSANEQSFANIKGIIKKSVLSPPLISAYINIKKRLEYYNHPLSWYGIMSKKTFNQSKCKFNHVNSFLVKDLLGRNPL
ncbi:MAG: asparagine synthetase B family protein [Candidatus Saccharicenans sp.]